MWISEIFGRVYMGIRCWNLSIIVNLYSRSWSFLGFFEWFKVWKWDFCGVSFCWWNDMGFLEWVVVVYWCVDVGWFVNLG